MENLSLPPFFEYFIPTKIQFGVGLAKDLTESLAFFGTKVFILTDKNLVQVGLLEPILNSFGEPLEVVGIFDDIPPNSEVSTVHKAYEQVKAVGADLILAVGGGSVMDTAKAVNILKTLGGQLLDYQGVGVLEEPLGPLVCIPTTAGTGSEVTKIAVIKDNESKQKIPFVSSTLCPNLAILDPEMIVSLPKGISAATGMDALTHAIEAIVSIQRNFFAEAVAMQVVRLVVKHLEASVKDGSNLEHRSAMLVASTLGGMAFSDAGVGVVHALAHPLGGFFNVPHGMANSIMLPFGIEFNREVIPEKYVQIAECFGIREEDPQEAISQLITAIRQLAKDCGLPTTLKEANVPQGQFDELAEEAACDGAMYSNPKEAEVEDLQKLYEAAYV